MDKKSLMWIGIDPGVTGMIATISENESVHFHDYDESHLVEWLEFNRDCYQVDEIVIERVHGSANMGVSNAFKFGNVFGWIRGVLHAVFGFTPTQVTPQQWKKFFGLIGQDKDASRMKACELYPQAAHCMRYKKDHDKAEALLLAEYARRIAR